MAKWLWSDEVQRLSDTPGWPTEQSRHAWLQFLEGERKGDQQRWFRETDSLRVQWAEDAPPAGAPVVLEAIDDQAAPLVLTPDLTPLGVVKSTVERPRRDIVDARVGDEPGTVIVEYFGPRTTE